MESAVSFCSETPTRNGRTASWRGALRARLSNRFRGIRRGVTEPAPEGTPQGSGFWSFATEASYWLLSDRLACESNKPKSPEEELAEFDRAARS